MGKVKGKRSLNRLWMVEFQFRHHCKWHMMPCWHSTKKEALKETSDHSGNVTASRVARFVRYKGTPDA